MNKKKIGTFLCALTVALSSYAFADDLLISPAPTEQKEIFVQLNGKNINFTDSEGNVSNPQMINSRTMVPMRKIFEEFDAKVDWQDTTKTIVATTSTKEITLKIDDANPTVKDIATGEVTTISLDQAPTIRNNRTLVPVRFIAESLGKEVGWDNSERTVIIIDFDQFTEGLKTSVPELEKLFDVKFDEMKSFKSNTDVTGSFTYTKNANSSENEGVSVKGNLKMAVDKSEQVDMELDLDVNGEGEVLQTIKDSGYEGLKGRLYISKDKILLGLEKDGKMEWQDLSGSISMSSKELSLINKSDLSVSSYEDFIKMVKDLVGELDVSSYEKLSTIFNSLSSILKEISLTEENDGTKTLKLSISLENEIGALNLSSYGKGDVDGLTLDITLSVKDGKIVKDETSVIFGVTTEDGGKVKMDVTSSSTYTNVNEDFTLVAPSV